MSCDCGLAVEDPFHKGWHNITVWNEYIFAEHRKKIEALFDKTYRTEMQPEQRPPAASEEIPF